MGFHNIYLILGAFFLCGIISALIARGKNISAAAYFFLGAFLGPFGVLITYCVAKAGLEKIKDEDGHLKISPRQVYGIAIGVAILATVIFVVFYDLLIFNILPFNSVFEGINIGIGWRTGLLISVTDWLNTYWAAVMIIWMILLYIYFAWIRAALLKQGIQSTLARIFYVFFGALVFFFGIVLPNIFIALLQPLYQLIRFYKEI
ncbi:MAG: hypothetical protein M1269_09070 [Chloroflexi bacterium]|nr:hypothetical protein [Chloroflexota bacterium]